jgi:PAS domain S-box-containing protein
MEERTRKQLQWIKEAMFGTFVGLLVLTKVFRYLALNESPSELLLEGLLGVLIFFGVAHFGFRAIYQIHDRLWTSAREFQDIFDRAGDAIRVIDADFNIVKTNQAMAELAGVPQKDARGMKCFDHLKSPLCGTEHCILRQIQQGRKRVEEEIEARTADGRTKWIRLVATPSPDPDQKMNVTESVQDITGRKEASEALGKAKKAYQALVENIADWPWETDTKGRYIFCGPQVREMLGYKPGELLGLSPIEFLIHPDDIAELQKRFQQLALERQPMKGVHTRKLHRNGAVKHIETNFTPVLNEEGELLGFRGVDRDITERKQAEEALQRKNEELDAFVRTVSHDLKTPLTSVQGYASLLAKTADSLDEEGRLWLDRIQTNAKRMANLIDGLLELSRVGRVVGPTESVSLKSLVVDIAREREWKLQNESVEITWADDLPTVMGDRLRLRQVLANLIDNAAKFTDNQSHSSIQVGWQEADGFWEIWVQDNGIGIAPEDQGKIFGLFQRLEKSDTPGTGVGLALAKRIIDYHGGRIWVESEGVPGKGACFHFTLPQNHPTTESIN